jgi:hypothetical protein
MKNILLIITLFISWNAVAEVKVWYCIPDSHIGLTYSKDTMSYKASEFYNIDRVTVKQSGDYLLIPDTFGTKNFKPKECQRKYKTIATCSDGTKTFSLNTETGLATSSSSFGWIISKNDQVGGDDMVLVAWKCESF